MNGSKYFSIFPDRDRGDVSLLLVSIVGAAGVLTATYLVDRSIQENKIAKKSERRDQSDVTPINAAVVAKALVSKPDPSHWSTDDFVNDANYLPNVYPDPYISSANVINGTELQTALQILKPSVKNSIWSSDSSFSSNRTIYLTTTDTNRLSTNDLQALFTSAASATISSSPQLQSSSSSIRYSLQNCDSSGASQSNWTGYYCANADITSQSFVNGNTSPQSLASQLPIGLIPPPPLPKCNIDATPVTINQGVSVSIPIRATGVVKGYKFTAKVGATTLMDIDEPQKFIEANQIATENNVESFTFNSAAYTAQLPAGSQVTIDVMLRGITGNTTCPTKTITIQNPPSCTISFYGRNKLNGALEGPISKVHENSPVYTKLSVTNLSAGDAVRIQFAGMTLVDANYTTDPNGVIINPAASTSYVAVTAQGDNSLAFAAVGRIWRGGAIVSQCSVSSELIGKWIDTYGVNCSAVCATAGGLIPRMDKGGMSCLSSENYNSPAYGAKKNASNNPSFSFAALQQIMTNVFGSIWGGGTGDFEQLRYTSPSLNKTNRSFGGYCYWTNSGITNLASCVGNGDMDANACQTQDYDESDKVRACYCGRGP